jgi:hypothetical protein
MSSEIIVRVSQSATVSPEALAKALIDAGPEEFAMFWFSFAEIVKRNRVDLVPFGKAMAESMGGMRKDPLRLICRVMDAEEYQELYKRREI